MKRTNIFLFLLLIMGISGFENLNAETIMLQNLYGIVPMDDSTEAGNIGDGSDEYNPNYIVARCEGNVVKVDFDQPAGNVEVVISQSNGMIVHRQNAFNPQSMTIDMNGAETGRYLLEVYTDTEAVGGVFEVK